MTDRELEKVIKGLMCIAGDVVFCAHCKYSDVNGSGRGDRCKRDCAKDAIALLKAQGQKPISASIVDSDGGLMHWWACGNCQAPINPEDKFCHECGREVKWDG